MSALRIRHPGKPAADVDLGPCPEVRSHGSGYVQAAPIGEMQPLIVGTVHSGMSDGHSTPKAQAFSIHPENRKRPGPKPSPARCGEWMKLAAEPCGRRAGHHSDHRTAAGVEANKRRADRAQLPERKPRAVNNRAFGPWHVIVPVVEDRRCSVCRKTIRATQDRGKLGWRHVA